MDSVPQWSKLHPHHIFWMAFKQEAPSTYKNNHVLVFTTHSHQVKDNNDKILNQDVTLSMVYFLLIL